MSSCLCKDSRCPKPSPKNIGTGILSDKTISLYRDVYGFLERHLVGNPDRVFVSRIALRPTFVIASNRLITEFLNDKYDHFYNGLKDFFFDLFGHNLLFANASESREFRKTILKLFSPDMVANYRNEVTITTDKWIRGLSTTDPIIMYEQFKQLSMAINLNIFLGIKDHDKVKEVYSTATTHWHGIISVPLNVRMPLFISSSYRRALEAKNELLDVIEEELNKNEEPFLQKFNESDMDSELVKNHILVFICALIPKATASILTSFMDSSKFWYDKYVDPTTGDISDTDVESILMEVIRLCPPFVGGLRVAESEVELGDFHVPKGHGVFYTILMAHRDPEVFPQPNEFIPDRWTTFNAGDKDKMFGFGAGGHRCVGERLMWDVLVLVAKKLVKTFNWEHKEVFPPEIKYLPVARPKRLEPIILRKRS